MCAVMIDGDVGLDRRAERDELHRLDAIGRMLDERQLMVRVGARVAMAGKMLSARRDPRLLQRRDDPPAQPGHVLGPIGQRAVADDRILRVGENVEHRRVVERDPDRLELGGERAREPFGERLVAAPSERHHRRPLGERAP